MNWQRGWWLLLCAAAACGPSPEPPAEPRAAASRPSLFEQLHALGREEPPLDAVPEWGRATLERLVASLSDEGREELLRAEHPEALRRPLLHWAAGGRSLAVHASAVETSALSDDWIDLATRHDPPLSSRELVDVGNELVRRAAHHLLRERAADFVEGRTPSPAVLRQVATTAALLGREDLERSATVAWALAEPGVEANHALFRLHARALELEPAEAAFAQLETQPEAGSLLPSARAELTAVRTLLDAKAEPLVDARAQLLLARYDEARATLRENPAPGLQHATLSARADLDGSDCPGVLRRNSTLCRAAFTLRASEMELDGRLERAWAHGAARDAESVEHFLGLAFVMPLMLQHGHDGHALSREEFGATLESLSAHAAAAEADPRFEAVALLGDVLAAAVRGDQTSEPGRPVVAAEERTELRRRGLELLRQTPGAWSQRAALAALALSLQDDPLGPELEALEVDDPSLPTLGALELWTALADGDRERLGTIDSIVVRIAEQAPPEARTAWLLTYAEAQAALAANPEATQVLARLCQPLLAEGVPLPLRLRAGLDLAVIHAREGREADARRVVTEVLDAVPFQHVDSATTRDLWLMLAAYQTILSRHDGDPGEKRDLVSEELGAPAEALASASPSVTSWLAWWRAELGAVETERKCGGEVRCGPTLERQRAAAKAGLERLGPRTRALLERGVLPLGGAVIDLRYDARHGLEPRVGVELAFPLIEVPKQPGPRPAR